MKNGDFRLSVNDTYEFDVEPSTLHELDAIRISENHFHIIKDGVSHRAVVESFDDLNKVVCLKVNGSTYQVTIADHYDLLINKMGLSASITHKISEIKAPMPGLVLSLMVEPGQEVVHGDPLIILEAMKMENVIKSPGEGKVKRIVVEKGKAVDKGEVLIEME